LCGRGKMLSFNKLKDEETKRICARCKIEKPLRNFIKDNRRACGYGYCCLVCHREAENLRRNTPEGKISKSKSDNNYRQNNRETILLQKKNRKNEGIILINSHKDMPCTDCNKYFPPECMDFDHVLGKKIANVANMKSLKKEKIIEEIEKCEVVCAVCHRIRTADKRNSSENNVLLEHRLLINKIKSKPCIDCNECFLPVAMDLDHISGE